MGSCSLDAKAGTPQLVVDLYNAFSRSERVIEQETDSTLLNPEDSAALRAFIKTHVPSAFDAIRACREQQGSDWFASGYAAEFVDQHCKILWRILNSRDRGVLKLGDLSSLSDRLASFAPSGVYGLSNSRPVGAYLVQLEYVNPDLLRRLDEVSWPPANPVQEVKDARHLPLKTLADLLHTSIHRVRNLLSAESSLSKPTARQLAELTDVPADRIQVAYDMYRSTTTLHLEYPGKWINPRAAEEEDLSKGMGGVAMEISLLSFLICTGVLELLRSPEIRIERCTYCGSLYLPKSRSHRHENNFCCEKHRKRYKYENP